MIELQDALRGRLRALGFDVVRFVRLRGHNRGAERSLQSWLNEGMQADMHWMDRSAEKRTDPGKVLEGARSAILLGVNYWPGQRTRSPGAPIWARYALYEDYHDTLKPALIEAGKILEEMFAQRSDEYRYYVDSGPVLERGWAERGGVGFTGKNAMLISQDFGNWLFLSEILTKIDFVADPPLAPERPATPDKSRVGLYCGSCTRCIDACPTNAIRAPGVVDARRCISYQTIENKGIIPRELREQIGVRIYGCDVCLEVCPWNRFAQESRRVLLRARDELREVSLNELLDLDPESFARVFRKTAIKRTKLSGLLRNACIVAANTKALDSADRVVRLATHESPVVRAHAVWAAFRLLGSDVATVRLAQARADERDAYVLSEYAAEDFVAETNAASAAMRETPRSSAH
ncbi:MAG TPA: tRNA epoxyqueuosine(34) reductase QueG [Opitutaceae bacterium]|nr:tRNA epoxyqueuosine(34) reductase QueG [Opitutaceae bacterium]